MHVSSIPNTRIWFVATVTVLALAIALTLASKPASAQAAADVQDTVDVSANNAATLTLVLDASAANIGDVSPNGTGVNATGVVDTSTAGGSFYQLNSAVGAEVNSNASWTGTVEATPNGGSSADMLLEQLTWTEGADAMAEGNKGTSFSGTPDATAFDTATAEIAGEFDYDWDYGLDVLYVDDSGTFLTTATYLVTQG